jgi:hypothetical protein
MNDLRIWPEVIHNPSPIAACLLQIERSLERALLQS